MSDENNNENGEPGFIDHLFNMFGNVNRAIKKSASRTESPAPTKRRKLKVAFDEAPAAAPAKECCTAKRGD